jgi:hypothetical protein
MSAIRMQAEDVPTIIEHGDVGYICELTDFAEGPITDNDQYSDISFTMATTAGAITDARTVYYNKTEFYEYDLTAVYATGINISLTNYVEQVTDAVALQEGSSNIDDAVWYNYEDEEYRFLMDTLVKQNKILPYESVTSATRFIFYEYDSEWGTYDAVKCSSLLQLQTKYPNYANVYYYYDKTTNAYYIIDRAGIATKNVTLVSTQKNYTVKAIYEDAFRNNTKIQLVTLGRSLENIKACSFIGASNIQLALEPNNKNYTISNGILYDAQLNKIILASANINSQSIVKQVSEIEEYAFYNVQNDIVITSMNMNIQIGENQSDKVTFSHPSSHLDITPLPNNGYKINGTIVQENIDTLQFKGAYMDFTDVINIGTIDIKDLNNDSTLLYFNTDSHIGGLKNIINKDICENLVITDKRSFYCPKAFTATKATYTRTYSEDAWSTLCLPFSADDMSDNLLLGTLASFSEGIFTFNISDNITAYKPYLAKPLTSDFSTIVGYNSLVPATSLTKVTKGSATFQGVMEPQYVKSDENTYYYGVGTIDGVTNIVKFKNVKVNPFRAYLSVPANSLVNNSAVFRFVDAFDNEVYSFEASETTGIENVKSSTSNNIYNINGQRLTKANRGLNIINGKVVINK